MQNLVPSKQSQLFELDQWQTIIHSESWRVFLKLLKTHKEYLQLQSNAYLRKHDDRRAGEELAKIDDCEKLISLVQGRIESIRKELGD